MKLWLLRHAQVALPPGLCYGASDVPAHTHLTQAAAEATAPLLPRHAALWVSALGRAAQLAEVVHSLRPDLQPPHADARLNEMNFGQWELQPWSTIPRSAFDAWMADFAHHRFGGAESTQMLLYRVAEALGELRPATSTDVLWITHAGVIRAVRHILDSGGVHIREAAEWPKDAPEPGGWVTVEL